MTSSVITEPTSPSNKMLRINGSLLIAPSFKRKSTLNIDETNCYLQFHEKMAEYLKLEFPRRPFLRTVEYEKLMHATALVRDIPKTHQSHIDLIRKEIRECDNQNESSRRIILKSKRTMQDIERGIALQVVVQQYSICLSNELHLLARLQAALLDQVITQKTNIPTHVQETHHSKEDLNKLEIFEL